MLMRFDPFRDLDRMSQELLGSARTSMPMDAYRQGDAFWVTFDLPGVDPSSIEVTVEQNVLTVRAERSWRPAEGVEVVSQERPQGRFSRQLFLGEALDTEHISANYDRGVLTLTIPVAERAKPRRVEIRESASGPETIEAQADRVEPTPVG
jgi:HSP20 family protein